MKPPMNGGYGRYLHATEWYFNTINILYDYGVTISEIAARDFGAPPISFIGRCKRK